MNNIHEQPGHDLKSLIGENTHQEQFEQIVEQLLPTKAKEAFGAEAKDKVRDALLYVSTLASGPDAYFDESALRALLMPESDEELAVLIESMKELGIIEVGDQYIGPTPEEDEKDQEFLQKIGLNLPPKPRHTAKNRLRLTDTNLAANLHRIFTEYE